MECCEYGRLTLSISLIANTSLRQVGLCSRLILDFTSWMRAQRNCVFHGFFPSLSDGVVSWVRADRDLHHQFPRSEDDLWALRAGPEDLPESQSEVRGEEHRPGLWIREGVGGALQTCGRASFFTSGVHWWTLPRGQLVHVTFYARSNGNQTFSKFEFGFLSQGAEKILSMNESGELQDLLTKIEVGFSGEISLHGSCSNIWL